MDFICPIYIMELRSKEDGDVEIEISDLSGIQAHVDRFAL
jgi:hypothetical protein